MSFHDGPDVMQPEAEALDVVPVSGGDAMEPVKDALEVLCGCLLYTSDAADE